MSKDVNAARQDFERELKLLVKGPTHVVTERLIDLIKEIHLELRKR